jgi:hypothetical protein
MLPNCYRKVTCLLTKVNRSDKPYEVLLKMKDERGWSNKNRRITHRQCEAIHVSHTGAAVVSRLTNNIGVRAGFWSGDQQRQGISYKSIMLVTISVELKGADVSSRQCVFCYAIHRINLCRCWSPDQQHRGTGRIKRFS